jgi:hypothetical protein
LKDFFSTSLETSQLVEIKLQIDGVISQKTSFPLHLSWGKAQGQMITGLVLINIGLKEKDHYNVMSDIFLVIVDDYFIYVVGPVR